MIVFYTTTGNLSDSQKVVGKEEWCRDNSNCKDNGERK